MGELNDMIIESDSTGTHPERGEVINDYLTQRVRKEMNDIDLRYDELEAKRRTANSARRAGREEQVLMMSA